MLNRSGGLKMNQVNRRANTHENGGLNQAKEAAGTADIKLFTELLRERKRLNEKSSEKNNDVNHRLDESGRMRQQMSVLSQGIDLLAIPSHTSRLTSDVTFETVLSSGDGQKMDISIITNRAGSAEGNVQTRVIESVVAVIQRILVNEFNTGCNRQWSFLLEIDNCDVAEISIEYMGKDEWRLAVGNRYQSDHQDESDVSSFADLVTDIDEFCQRLQSGLRTAQPNLRISALPSKFRTS